MAAWRFFLLPLAWLYYAGFRVDRWWRSRRSVSLPGVVLSIGNLSVGGTGKTPMLIKACRDLLSMNIKPAVLTRGYRGLRNASSPPTSLSDEVRLMKHHLPGVPMGVGADRVASAKRLLDQGSEDIDCFVLDDGFQHWPIQRQFDFVCVDATDPFARAALLPMGRWREPLSALGRAQAVLLTRCELVEADILLDWENRIKRVAPNVPLLHVFFESLLKTFQGEPLPGSARERQTVVALSAVGRPQAFEEGLRRKGGTVLSWRFQDHHRYNDNDIRAVERARLKRNAWLVTTEKDAVKLNDLSLPATWSGRSAIATIRPAFSEEHERIWRSLLRKAV